MKQILFLLLLVLLVPVMCLLGAIATKGDPNADS